MLIVVFLIVLWSMNTVWAAQVFVCTHPDDSVSVVQPADRNKRPGESEPEFLRRTLARFREANPSMRNLPCVQMPAEFLPQDHTHRKHWRLRDGKIVVDPPTDKPTSLPKEGGR